MLHIAGDESGSLTNSSTAIVTTVAVMTNDPAPLRWIIPRVKRGVRWQPPKSGRVSEFKFHNTTDTTRAAVLSGLAKEEVQIVGYSLYKGSQIVEDSVENYGLLLCGLLERCVASGQQQVNVVFDIHFTQPAKQRELAEIIRARLALDRDVQFEDSQRNPFVQLADFVAGAVNYARSGRSVIFYDLIRPRVVGDELRLWKEARREWVERGKS